MKDFWKTLKLGVYVFALPLIATAAASAQQWISNSAPIVAINNTVAVAATPLAKATEIATFRNHNVSMNEDGAVRGRLATINEESRTAFGVPDLKVFFVQNGEIAKQVYTNQDGTFEVFGLNEGAYTFIASGENGFAAYGVNVVQDGDEKTNFMEASAISPQFDSLRAILEESFQKDVVDAVVETKPSTNESKAKKIAGTNRVRLTTDGLKGRVASLEGGDMVAGTVAHIIKNNIKIAESNVDTKGEFLIADLEPGVYDLIVTGSQGIAAVSFETVAPVDEAGAVLVSVPTEAATTIDAEGYAQTLDVVLTNPTDNVYLTQTFQDTVDSTVPDQIVYETPVEIVGDNVGMGIADGGSFAGSGGGGGAGGIGGGNVGRLLGVAGLVIGIIALSDDNTGNAGPGSPIEP